MAEIATDKKNTESDSDSAEENNERDKSDLNK